MKIAILIGHGKGDSGGYDPGACSNGYQEYQLGREIGKYAANALRAAGHTVDLLNYDGKYNLPERIAYCNARSYDLVAEVHLNAGKGTGCEVYHSIGDHKGRELAATVSAAVSSTLSIRDRGARTKANSAGTDYFGIIRQTKASALLIETCFIDSGDVAKVATNAGRKAAGEAIAAGIIKVVGRVAVEPPKSTAESYAVKIGMFNRREDAKETADKLTALGFYNEIKQEGAQWYVLVYSFTNKAKADALAWVLNNQRYTVVKAM